MEKWERRCPDCGELYRIGRAHECKPSKPIERSVADLMGTSADPLPDIGKPPSKPKMKGVRLSPNKPSPNINAASPNKTVDKPAEVREDSGKAARNKRYRESHKDAIRVYQRELMRRKRAKDNG